MQTKLDFKISKVRELEVVGQGKMISTPCQVGEWWVTPAQQFTGKIPPEVYKRMFETINEQGIKVVGVLIAEDMREIEKKRELEEKKAEARRRAKEDTAEAVKATLKLSGQILLALIALPFLIFDPMCILVCEDGRWICCGTWYN